MHHITPSLLQEIQTQQKPHVTEARHNAKKHSLLHLSASHSATPLDRHPLVRHPPAQCMLGYTHPLRSACWDTVNKRAVLIPLECILVLLFFTWEWYKSTFVVYYYCLPTKWQEGNVFTDVCHSVQGERVGKPGQRSLWVVDMPHRFLPMEGLGMPGSRSLRGAVVGMSEGTWCRGITRIH